MARVAYVGVKDKAKKVKKMYIGVGNKARKVVKAYIGVDNVARIFYTADWWIPYGLKESNCMAAWVFYHASSQSVANKDISKKTNGKNITDYRYCTFNADTGYYITAGVDASGLKISGSLGNPVTGVFWYTGLPEASSSALDGGRWFHVQGNGMDMAARMGKISSILNNDSWVNSSIQNYPAFCLSYSQDSDSTGTTYGHLSGFRGNSNLPSSGVVAFDRAKPNIYVNGNAIGATAFNINTTGRINNVPVATKNGYATIGGGSTNTYIRAAAFFDCTLTARQHSDLAKMIKEIK